MIEITGDTQKRKGNYEIVAAEDIAAKILKSWPWIKDNPDARIKIIVSPQWDSGARKESDLMIIGEFKNPIKFKLPLGYRPLRVERINRKTSKKYIDVHEDDSIAIRNFIFLLECKKVSAKMLDMREGQIYQNSNQMNKQIHLYVKYPNNHHWDNVSNQIEESLFSFRSHVKNFKDNPDKKFKPSPARGIYLQSIMEGKKATRTFYKGHTWQYMFIDAAVQIFRFTPPRENINGLKVWSSYKKELSSFYYDSKFLPDHKFSDLDQKQMIAIARKIRKDAEFPKAVGRKLLVLSGSGGTGKTIKLLQLAHNIERDEYKRIIILTYNVVLVQNIKRLLSLMGIRNINADGGGIKIQTVQSYMWYLMNQLGLLSEKEKEEYLEIYDKKIQEIAESIRHGDINFSKLRENSKYVESHHYAFIDEGQDWPKSEAYIISEIFGYKNIVVAQGINQEVRGSTFQWRQILPADKEPEQVYQLRYMQRARRMKTNLLHFTQRLAEEFILDDSYSELLPGEEGGDTFIVVGDYLLKDEGRFRNFINERKIGIKCNIDLLHCVPSKDTIMNKDLQEKESITADEFRKYGFPVWDATGSITRGTRPSGVDVMRFVNYQSSRGLEGWSVFCHGFDNFFDEMITKGNEAYGSAQFQTELFKDNQQSKEEFSLDFAGKWLCIATTRAVDSLVIQINDKNSLIGQKLFNIAKTDDSVYWLE